MGILRLKLFLVLTCLLLISCVGLAQDGWQFTPGVILASGNQGGRLKGVNGDLLTLNGWRRISRAKLEDVSIYHALVFYPKAPLIGGGGGFSNKGPLSTLTVEWILQKNPPNDYQNKEEKSLEIKYHALERTVSVGSETFSLANGNLFIIRLNESWSPTVMQLKAHFEERAEVQKVLDFFKSVLRDEDSIQKLELSC